MAATRTAASKASIENLRESLPFQRREWVVQRIGWGLLALVLIAGAVGLLGRGPLAKRTLANAHFSFEYEWLAHRDAESAWKVTPREPPVDGRHRIAFDAHWTQHFEITAIQPEPQSARLSGGRWVYEFQASDARGLPIVFYVAPRKTGPLEGTVQLDDSAALTLAQFVYP